MPVQTRRYFLKRTLGAAAGSLLAPEALLARRKSARKPNVVLIFTDDQGTIDLNCYGAKDLHTPNLDRLAREGTRFTQFYVAAPVCSPSRAALMTGRYPQRAGVPGNVSSTKGEAGMNPEQVTIAEMLKSAGYATGHVGKWHLGYTPETMPNGQGYDSSFGHMGGCIDNYSHFFYWQGPNRHDLWEDGKEIWRDGEYFGDMMVDRCKKFIDEKKKEPFFLYWAINMPHYPLQGTEKWRKKYDSLPAPRRMYAEFVSTVDEMVGEVVAHLEKLKLREDTIIIWLSDHGHSVEQRTFSGGGSAGDFRGHKFTLWEGGIRVPCIVSWPGRIPKNAVRDQVGISIDWMPTIAEYCGVKPPDREIDGKSITGLIDSADAPSPHDVLHWQTGRDGRHWAVRQGKWKLVHNGPATGYKGRKLPAEKDFLSDMTNDTTETKNIAENHPEIVERLTKLHNDWTKGVQQQ